VWLGFGLRRGAYSFQSGIRFDQQLVTSLAVLRLADLVLDVNLRYWLALEPLHHDHGFSLWITISSIQGCFPFSHFTLLTIALS